MNCSEIFKITLNALKNVFLYDIFIYIFVLYSAKYANHFKNWNVNIYPTPAFDKEKSRK